MTETRRLVNVENVNERYSDGSNDTLLQRAARKGYYEIVKELLIHHPDIDAENESGCTAIMEASCKGHSEITKELINHHAGVNLQDKHGTTPLMAASKGGYETIVKNLIKHNADVNVQSKNGSTALIMASKWKRTQIVMELINHNADLNLQDNKGNTALHSVLMEIVTDTTINIVKLLLSDKTDLEKKNKKKKSVLQLAKESQKQDIIEMIESFFDQKKVEAAKKELKKLQANEIINKKKREIARVSAVNDEVLELIGSIDKMEKEKKILEEKLKKYREEVTLKKCLLKRKIDSDEFKSYKKLKQEHECLERSYEEEAFHKVIQPTKRECPICITEMTPEKKIYQCQSGHFFCEECFGKIRETTKSCPVCRVYIASISIRCRALEDVIKEEAN